MSDFCRLPAYFLKALCFQAYGLLGCAVWTIREALLAYNRPFGVVHRTIVDFEYILLFFSVIIVNFCMQEFFKISNFSRNSEMFGDISSDLKWSILES